MISSISVAKLLTNSSRSYFFHRPDQKFSRFKKYSTTTSSLNLQELLKAKENSCLSFKDIATQLGRSENWTAGLFYGQHQPNQSELSKLYQLLESSASPTWVSKSTDTELQLPRDIQHILQLSCDENKLITAQGWVRSIRKQKHVSFAELVDGSTPDHLQIVVSPIDTHHLQTGCAIRVLGHLVASRGGHQTKELRATNVHLIGPCPPSDYPLQKKDHTKSFLRKIPHLRLRTPHTAALLRLRSSMISYASSFLQNYQFIRVEAPLITFSDAEGAGEVFKVNSDHKSSTHTTQLGEIDKSQSEFFGRQAFLTVSSQLHLEALSASLSKVYHFGPTFRAERSSTNRHLAEFWMLEAEMSFIDDLQVLMDLVEHLIKSIILNMHQTKNSTPKDLQLLNAPLSSREAADTKWRRISYSEAVETICSYNQKTDAQSPSLPPINWGEPLGSEHEKWLASSFAKGPVFVTDYPKSLKPFYVRESNSSQNHNTSSTSTLANSVNQFANEPVAACFDLLVPEIGEVAGGSLREPNLSSLRQNMLQKGIISLDSHETDPTYQWYLDLRQFGSAPSGGFGIGWERLVSWLAGIENVRECIAFPRLAGSGHC
ncbi:hypothetical protein O181_001785 [Austropuccinia psidii MF-1]|uniref:asparagine--tRNA ligase n=1 Tax=Austropuccinia psidii MF-1 TaxID=1389203 RepID=A0A9Q3GC69_9BASI|nr:hypothetical protein [Austropuccinia psidii MF-1]